MMTPKSCSLFFIVLLIHSFPLLARTNDEPFYLNLLLSTGVSKFTTYEQKTLKTDLSQIGFIINSNFEYPTIRYFFDISWYKLSSDKNANRSSLFFLKTGAEKKLSTHLIGIEFGRNKEILIAKQSQYDKSVTFYQLALTYKKIIYNKNFKVVKVLASPGLLKNEHFYTPLYRLGIEYQFEEKELNERFLLSLTGQMTILRNPQFKQKRNSITFSIGKRI